MSVSLILFILGFIDVIFDNKIFSLGFVCGLPFALIGIYLYYKVKGNKIKDKFATMESKKYVDVPSNDKHVNIANYREHMHNFNDADDSVIYYGSRFKHR